MYILFPNFPFFITPYAGAFCWLNSIGNEKRRKLISAVHYWLPFWWTGRSRCRKGSQKEREYTENAGFFSFHCSNSPGWVVYGRIFSCKHQKPTLPGLSRERYWEPSGIPGTLRKSTSRRVPLLLTLGLYHRHYCCSYCSNCWSCHNSQRFFLMDSFPCFSYWFKSEVCACHW